MIKNSLKNFYKNLIYLFVPMGIVYLFFLITVCLLFTTFFSSLSSTLVQLTDLIKTSVDESSTSVSEFIAYALEQIDWNQGFGNTLQQIFDTDWIQNTIKGFFEAINASTVGFEEQFTNIISNFVSSIAFAIISAIIICFLGIVLANYATKYVIRRKVAKRNIKKFIIARTIVPLVQSIIIGLFFVLVFYLQYYSILVAILFLLKLFIFL